MAATEPTPTPAGPHGRPSARARKGDHLRIAAGDGVLHESDSGLRSVRLRHRALPERDLGRVELATELVGHDLEAPIVVSAMTGGTDEAEVVNRRLAKAASLHGVAMALGSGRVLLEDPELRPTFTGPVRPPLLLANIGVGELRRDDGPQRAARLVAMLDADGLTVHTNPLQEAIQPEGDTRFSGVADAIAATVVALRPRPVIVKEVGFGMDGADLRLLVESGIAAVDVAGAGGTNWALVEGHRDTAAIEVASAFADWGVSTVDALLAARRAVPELPAIASGGVRDGVDVARGLALGAVAGGLARPLLLAAREDRAGDALGALVRQLRVATWLAGARASRELGPHHLDPATVPA